MPSFDESLLEPVSFNEDLLEPVDEPKQSSSKFVDPLSVQPFSPEEEAKISRATLPAQLRAVQGEDKAARFLAEDRQLIPPLLLPPEDPGSIENIIGMSKVGRGVSSGVRAIEGGVRSASAPSTLPLLPLAAYPPAATAMGLYFGGQALGGGAGEASVGIQRGEPETIGSGVGQMALGGLMAAKPVVEGGRPILNAVRDAMRPTVDRFTFDEAKLEPLPEETAAKPKPELKTAPVTFEAEFGPVNYYKVNEGETIKSVDGRTYKPGESITEQNLKASGFQVPEQTQTAIPKDDWRVVVTGPRTSESGEVAPGHVQIVDPSASEQSGKITLPEGSPDFSALPEGRYSYAEAVDKLKQAQAGKEPSAIQVGKSEALPLGETPGDSGKVGARVPEPGKAPEESKINKPGEPAGEENVLPPEVAPKKPTARQIRAENSQNFKLAQEFKALIREHGVPLGFIRDPDLYYDRSAHSGGSSTASIKHKLKVDNEIASTLRRAVKELGGDYADSVTLSKLLPKLKEKISELNKRQTPKLRPGEKGTGDLLQGQDAPFNLSGESGVDTERIAAEKRAAESDLEAADKFAAEHQGNLFDEPAPKTEEGDPFQTAKRDNTFERAQAGDEKAFDDLDAQFREIYPEPEDLAYRGQPNPNQVFTKEQFASKFNAAFASHEFYKVLDIIKATSDVSIWKPFLQDLFKRQAKDPVAAEKAEWMRHVFNGTEPKNVVPRPAPRPAGTQRPPPPVTPNPRPKAGQPPPPRPPVTPPSPPPVRIPVEPIPGGGAKSPFKIIEDFSEAIGKAIRVRRLKANTLGTYSPGSTLTAEKFAGDLDTAAHELAGHWMDDRYGIGAPWAKAKTRSPYDTELAKFWIHGSVTPRSTLRYRRAEGVAEYIRAYVVNPKMAKAEAPNFTAYFEKTVTPEGLKAIRDFSNDVRIWAGEDPLVRAGLNIRMEPPSLRERLWEGMRGRGFGFEINPIDRLRMWFDDPYHYAVKAFKEANALRGGQLLPKDNFELQARLLSTHDARMSDEFEHGLTPLRPAQAVNARGQLEVQRLIDPVTKQPMTMNWLLDAFDKTSKDKFNQDMRDASAYMVAQRTVEKGKQLGRESNISGIGAGILTDKSAAEELLRRVAADPVRETRLKEAARRYRLWADQNLNMLVDSGRLSKDAAREIRNNNEQYVDMHRLSMEFEEGNRAQRGGKIGTTRDVIRRFKGSTLELDNVYSNLLEQTDSIQKEAFRNVTLNTFVDSLRNVRELHGANLKDFEQFGSKASSADRNTITVWKNGKPEYWKFDPDIHDSLKGLGELGTHAFIDLLSLPSQFARYMITHGPQFLLRNPMRDTFERSVVSRNGSKPWDILRGYTPEELSRYEVFGGGQFGNYIVDRHVWNRELKKAAAELRKDPTNILLSPLKLKHAWEDLSEKSEKIGRIAEFRRAFEMGKKEFGYDDYNAALYAAGEARGLMDFAKAGTVMRVINRLVPFSNARVRGLARSAFSIGENPAGFAMRWGMFVLVPTILNAIYQRQNKDTWDEYQQLPAYQRDFFWNFKVGPYWLRIPRPHELGVMAGGVERAIDRILGDRRAMEGWAGSAANAVLPINTPVEGTGPLKTFLELQFNRDTFRGRDIVPAWEKDLKVELRKGTAHASAVSKGIASALKVAGLEIDPRNLDYLLGSLGGAGQTAAMISTPHRSLVDTALKTTGYIAESSGAASRDVQWVTDWAKQNGKLGTKDFQTLRDARKLVMDATDAVDRDNKSRSLRHLGTAMRNAIEKQTP
jgi:hypothetical protein